MSAGADRPVSSAGGASEAGVLGAVMSDTSTSALESKSSAPTPNHERFDSALVHVRTHVLIDHVRVREEIGGCARVAARAAARIVGASGARCTSRVGIR
jgi:hypothetical protein